MFSRECKKYYLIFIMSISFLLLLPFNSKAATGLKPIMWVETPQNNSIVKNNITIGGWALNPSGIKEVNILINGQVVGKATIGINRPDVDSVFPGYNEGTKSGFMYKLDVNSLRAGTCIVQVEAVGNDYTKISQSVVITIEKLKPIMWVETPQNNSTIKNNITIGGWVLNPSGIKEVNILISGQAVGKATTGIDRPDVDSVFPGYTEGTKGGFAYKLDTSNLKPGAYTLQVEAVGNDSTKVSQSIVITVEKMKPLMWIESLQNNLIIKNDYPITGWALNPSGVKEILISIDGQTVGSAIKGLYRQDVNTVFPGYTEGENSGFNYNLEVNTLKNGDHVLGVKVIGKDLTEITQNITIRIDKPKPMMWIESPDMNIIPRNNLAISGWSLSSSNIKEIRILVDGQLAGDATKDLYRPDVDKVFPGYRNGVNSGFSYILDTSQYNNGIHKITVVSIGVDDVSCKMDIFINIQNDTTVYVDYNRTLYEMLDTQVNVGGQTDKTGSWTSASREDIEGYLNPNNFLDDYGKYQFLKLNFTYGISSEDINKLLIGKGVLQGKGQVFLDAAKANNISPIYLVSHALLETGNGTSRLANGILVNQTNKLLIIADKDVTGKIIGYHVEANPNPTPVEPKVSYNIFGIKAFDYNPVELKSPEVFASEYAYSQGWLSVDDAIRYGAEWIADGYINSPTYVQNTLYEMRWNPQSPGTHQYASDIAWAYKQIDNIKSLVDQCPNAVLAFEIPRYKSVPLSDKTIVLDAGHGGSDPGAVANGYQEKDLNIQIVQKLGEKLKNLGANVLYTRQPTNDVYIELADRVKFANDNNADLFISIHHDSSESASASGTSTHYSTFRPGIDNTGAYFDYGGKRYQVLYEMDSYLYYSTNGVIKSISINNVTAYDATPSDAAVKSSSLAKVLVDQLSGLGVTSRGSIDHNLYVTRWTNMPSVLVEVGFISNLSEISTISAPSYQDQIAQKIADSVNTFFNN